MPYLPSKYQQAIYDWISAGKGNAIIQAVAGSGKTSTIVQATNLIPRDKNCLFVAFNKSIAEELKTRLAPHIEARTLHSLGLRVFTSNLPQGSRPITDSSKVSKLIELELEEEQLEYIEKREITQFLNKIVPKIKNTLIDYTNYEEVTDVMAQYNIEFTVNDTTMRILKRIMTKNNAVTHTIDFDDMIYLPVVKGFTAKPYDWIFVDEAQDLNKTQFELIKKVCGPTTRIVAVGDKRQSIYAFRGADTNSMNNFKTVFNAEELPLSICYRCPASHIRLAKEIVPEIEAKEGAEEGLVSELYLPEALDKMNEKDLVLCRTNAPLIKVAFSLIRVGKKAVIRGRDIGANLAKMVDRYKAVDLSELYSKLEDFRRLQEEKLALIEKGKVDKKQKNVLMSNIDSVETLEVIMEDCRTIKDLKDKIDTIFTDNKEGIICSSVHKAKGLEADNIFLINRHMMPHPSAKTPEEIEQEYNILYVALTRGKKTLTIIKNQM